MTTLLPIKKHLTKINKGAKGANKPQFIVIHFVGASGQALANALYFEYVYREASAQYFIDPNNIYQVVEDDTPAWHIGDGAWSGKGDNNGYVKYGQATNNNAIGIELCQDTSTGNNVWEWQFHKNTVIQALLLTAHLQKKYNIPNNRVIRHFDASGKSCPGNWMPNNWSKWHVFKADLALMNSGKVDNTPVVRPPVDDGKTPVKEMYTIVPGDTLWKIAQKHKTTVAKLREWNNIEGDLIFPESKIFVKQPVTKPVTVEGVKQNGKLVPIKGTFQFTEIVNVRNQAAAYGNIPATYYPGESVKYDGVTHQNGHIWLQYTSHKGTKQYVSAGTPSVAYGKYV